ncbi:MAG: VWA domain-containing protein [Bryobacterales bacterium]|nr:VWA domain-containing protein [Bryobacterales bacterium]
MVLVDVSASMLYPTGIERDDSFNKMTAVKDALRQMVGSPQRASGGELAQGTELMLAEFFDDSIEPPRVVQPLTKDLGRFRTSVESLAAIPENLPTALYHGMRFALEEASRAGVPHVLVLTDGKDESPDYYLDRQRTAYLRWQRSEGEPQVLRRWRELGESIQVHTLGIGNPNAGLFTNAYVDCGTLTRLSIATKGTKNCIDTARLSDLYNRAPDAYKDELAKAVGDFLRQMTDYIGHEYTIEFTFDPKLGHPSGDNVATIHFTAPNGQPPQDIPFRWNGETLESIMIPPVPPNHINTSGSGVGHKPDANLAHRIFLIHASLLALLATLPVIVSKVATLQSRGARNRAIVKVSKDSAYLGKECANEQWRGDLFKVGDTLVICPNPECAKPHHIGCWHMNVDSCWYCKQSMPLQDEGAEADKPKSKGQGA